MGTSEIKLIDLVGDACDRLKERLEDHDNHKLIEDHIAELASTLPSVGDFQAGKSNKSCHQLFLVRLGLQQPCTFRFRMVQYKGSIVYQQTTSRQSSCFRFFYLLLHQLHAHSPRPS